MPMLTQVRLKELLDYDSATGIFRWKKTGYGRSANLIAGGINRKLGYHQVAVDGRRYYAHRLAWLYVTGAWPVGGVDHKDRNRANNSFENLREADQAHNLANSDRKRLNNAGYKGVTKVTNCALWVARIRAFGKTHYLGCFPSPEAAHQAYCSAAKKHFGEFANFGASASAAP